MPAPFASLYDILLESAMEELGAEHEAASRFARVATQKTSGFFLNLDHVPGTLALNNVRFSDFGFQVEWYSVATFAVCPKCGKITFHKHSKMYYPEQVQDKGVQGRPLWHVINRCKWICDNDQCLQLVFHEQFPGFVEKKCARMTVAFADYVSSIAINTSNRAAVRILRGEGATISKETVGRIVLRRAAPILEDNFYRNAGNVDKVGIDDINLRKGDHSSSCMVIVDLDKRELLGIVRGTTKEDAKKALVMLPNVCIVGRDRGTAMASAANDLDLTSVADGFHITANMHDAIEKTLRDLLPPSIYIPCGTGWVGIANDAESDEVIVSEMASLLTEEDIRLRVRLAHLSPKAELAYTRTLKILELTLQGKHASEISDIIGITIEDVRKLRKNMRETIADVETKIDEFLANPYVGVKKQKSVSASARPSRESKVEPFRGVVVAMRNEGKSHWAIYEELQKLGFEGSHSTVDNYIIKLGRESSIDAEMRETREKTHDFFGATPERPERISVRIYSAKTVYKRLLAQIAEQRKEATDKDPDKQDSIPAKKKSSPIPTTNRMNLPLELMGALNWMDPKAAQPLRVIDESQERAVDSFISTTYPVWSHLVQFGLDYHAFMDTNDVAGLESFIAKYSNDSHPRLAQFAHGLKLDIDAIRNTLLYPEISSGPVEGLNNLVKLIKRMGGNRANLDMLLAKVILQQKQRAS